MKAVLFDLDGTLLDTKDMILNSFEYAYTKVFGAEAVPPSEQLLSMVGIPLKRQMEIISPEHNEELFSAYHERNRQIHDKMLRAFDGAERALAALKHKGLRMVVITSKRHDPAVSGLEGTHLASYFEFVVGSDDYHEHKPSPGPLLWAAERMGVEPSDCAYVGDSPYDMQAANAAKMYAIGAVWGMFTAEELTEAGAQILVPALDELAAVIN